MKAAIVILNFNGEKHLRKFLPSVIEFCPDWAKIIIADNGSSDGSKELIADSFPQAEWLALDKNYGFAGGYNHALAEIDATYYVILNNDVEVTPGWLDILVGELDAKESIVAAQPKIRSYMERGKFEHAGACGGFIDKYGYPFCRGRIFNNCETDIGQHEDPREVFWATGACMVIKSDAFWKAGGFDEDLFAHMEEIDLCWRLKNQNYQIYCYPSSRVYHLGGGTLDSKKPHKTYLNFRNNLSIIVKNETRQNLLGLIFKRMILDGAAACSLLFSSGIFHSIAVLRAHFYFYTHIPILLRKRKELKKLNNHVNRTGFYRQSIVRDFFFKKRKVFGALPSRFFIRQDRTK